jgi:hypothetical protein
MWIRLLPVSVAAILVLPIFFSASVFNMDMQLYYHDSSNTSFGFVNGADSEFFILFYPVRHSSFLHLLYRDYNFKTNSYIYL